MRVKYVSHVTFYHLSNRLHQQKVNAMQNMNILLFVRLLSLTSLKTQSLGHR